MVDEAQLIIYIFTEQMVGAQAGLFRSLSGRRHSVFFCTFHHENNKLLRRLDTDVVFHLLRSRTDLAKLRGHAIARRRGRRTERLRSVLPGREAGAQRVVEEDRGERSGGVR